jgi:hypothetical protein
MAKYRVTVVFTTRLGREVEADSAQDAERLAEAMSQSWRRGENADVIGSEHHQRVEVLPPQGGPSWRWEPVGQ